MAKVNVIFGRAIDGIAQVMGGVPDSSESITSSATSQASVGASKNSSICQITATGGNVCIWFGAAPVATAASILIADGQTREFGLLAPGTKVAVIDA